MSGEGFAFFHWHRSEWSRSACTGRDSEGHLAWCHTLWRRGSR